MKRLVILGASGSIGTQTIDIVLQHPDMFSVTALSVGKNIAVLKEILKKVSVDTICVQLEKDQIELQREYPQKTVLYGDQGLIQLVERTDYDVLVNALVGFAGCLPTLHAIQTHHTIALANKETLVCAGELITAAAKANGVSIYPIDSEHSAIFQCLQGNRKADVKNLWITCSGGAFRNKTREELSDVTVKDALAHPNWSMGAKITIDCANLMNKGFEVIEAHWLFDIPYEQIQVVLHPQSIVHSMVEYVDHSVMAQMGAPDMRLPIQYSLTWPERYFFEEDTPLDLYAMKDLHFEKPDTERFPLLKVAYEAGEKGGNLCACMNGANEVANAAFRNGTIPFLMIESIVTEAVQRIPFQKLSCIEDVVAADTFGRDFAEKKIEDYLNR